jgi:hypothetical protein
VSVLSEIGKYKPKTLQPNTSVSSVSRQQEPGKG